MNPRILIKSLRQLALVLVVLFIAVTPSFAVVDFYLIAKEVPKTMPDNSVITMWGFAEDIGGACFNVAAGNTEAARTARLAAAVCQDPVASVPGPQLTAPNPADPNVRIRLVNLLTMPVSIVIPGQEIPFSADNNGPTWDDGTVGPRGGDLTRRVRSFGREAPANGGKLSYIWTNARGTPFKPGTFLYQSGTDPALQVHMGLYGAVTKDAAVGEAYPGISYDAEVILLYSEIDPTLHAPPAAAKPLNYKPTWFLVNGEPFEAGVTPPEPAGNTAGTTLIRFLNAGLKSHAPTLVNGPHMSVISEDGNPLPYPRQQYSVRLGPGKTSDALWNPTAAGQYPIYDRTLQLTNAGETGGGMLSYLTVAADGGPIANDDPEPPAVYSVAEDDPAGLTVNAAAGVLANDTGPGGAGDPLPVGSTASLVTGTISGALILNPDGSFIYEPLPNFNGEDAFTYRANDGTTDSNVATATIVVIPVNDAPVANPDAASTDDNTPVTIDVLANDTDVDGEVLSVSNVDPTGTNGGTVTTDGSTVTYDPSTFTGTDTDTFTYTASDGNGGTDTDTVTVNVSAAFNQPPVTVDDSGSTTACIDAASCAAAAIIIDVLANDDDPDGLIDPTTTCLRLGNYPNNCTNFNPKTTENGGTAEHELSGGSPTGRVIYTPPPGFLGTDSFRYNVRDDDGAPTVTDGATNKAKVRVNVVQ